MPAVARVGDLVEGVCDGSGHLIGRAFIGTWTTGSSTVTADGIGVIRVGDEGITDCGHIFHASTGSVIGSANGLAIHRVGDLVIVDEGGYGTTMTGSSTVTSN